MSNTKHTVIDLICPLGSSKNNVRPQWQSFIAFGWFWEVFDLSLLSLSPKVNVMFGKKKTRKRQKSKQKQKQKKPTGVRSALSFKVALGTVPALIWLITYIMFLYFQGRVSTTPSLHPSFLHAIGVIIMA